MNSGPAGVEEEAGDALGDDQHREEQAADDMPSTPRNRARAIGPAVGFVRRAAAGLAASRARRETRRPAPEQRRRS